MSFLNERTRRRIMSEQEKNLKRVLEHVNDLLAEDRPPLQGDMAVLRGAYGKANNNAACPCGSGRNFADCCKQLWQVAERGEKVIKKGVKREAKRQAKEEKRAAKNDVWFCKLGVDEKGRPIVDTKDMEGDKLDGFSLAGFVLSAYHSLLIEGQIMMVNGACGKLHRHILSQLAGPSKPPLGVVKP